MTTIAYGSKYAATKDLSRTEIAKLVRADIKAAVRAGTLPAWTYSVRCSSYSGGGSIKVRIANVTGPILGRESHELLSCGRRVGCIAAGQNPRMMDAAGADVENPAAFRLSAELRRVLATVEGFLADYNYDGSDAQSDYFNVRFHSSVDIDWQEEARDREILIIELRAQAASALVDPEVLAIARQTTANDVEVHPARAPYVPVGCIAAIGWE